MNEHPTNLNPVFKTTPMSDLQVRLYVLGIPDINIVEILNCVYYKVVLFDSFFKTLIDLVSIDLVTFISVTLD